MIDENIRRLESGESFSQLDKDVIEIIKKTIDAISPKKVIVRIAGGWVRDKIMGRENDDIDIAISGATCNEFSDAMVSVLGPNTKRVLLEANHEQLKHIDTARVCLFHDFWLDICSLRSALYSEGEKLEGTAVSAALHRDFSMNAIFFNVQTMKIEDYVNGVQSIKDKIIRTPIPAMQDFTDDPNRIIRCFRFVAKYDFKIDPQIYEAIPKIIPLFMRNIAKDRVATELIKLMHSDSSFLALENLINSGMLNPVFDPESLWSLDKEETLKRIRRAHQIEPNLEGENKMILYFAAIFLPLVDKDTIPDPAKKNKFTSAVHYAIVRAMKLQNVLADNVKKIHLGFSLVEAIYKGELNRVTGGRFVMSVGPLYKLVRPLLMDDELLKFYDEKLNPFIVAEKLEKSYEMKQLMDGVSLANIYGVKPGPVLKDLIEEMINWQLSNPNRSSDDYKKYILENKKQK
ncbi:polyA polymerase family protein [Trichomonas vaginalis G3]|uniref:PolyA polymerase family protein n=1 Tax=Trichomonas vaginalis (strain ATCC PRA-98 / G3) TaxID=412133 RepID=A2FD21_TRIV3|nr:tRNA cytidylyltransferase protein [Trichomonas vaginalis G3]EAX97214.1 polyA polymerase family protein [Trichomonas vaginalis G3]KAI5536203.1 tRNA cytidylyltransferase protein [Trichomonas vaginalis G3]|eukprot:XP_001310144.1 polyA polymerase family protein [Trichomonas vaginalis G3]